MLLKKILKFFQKSFGFQEVCFTLHLYKTTKLKKPNMLLKKI